MNEAKPTCPQCGAPLKENAAGGLCPNCLMALNLQTETVFTDETKQTEAPLPPEAIAPHFPQLEIIECLGRGGMGVVYKARQKTLNRLVALKLLAPERVTDAKFAERFTREAQALAALNHPNIVTIHDFGQAGGFYYLLMEYVDGLNLRQLLRGRKFTPEEALTIIPPLCDALQFAHDRGIVHRDIKPENLLLDKNGRIKVADFGIAKMLGTAAGENPADAAAADNATRSAVGTPAYSAPEQKANPQRVDSRADIYSLGVVFYEMLTGELPGKRIEAPSRKVQIDVRLDEIVLRALEQKPELRFQQASAMKTQVETLADHPQPQPSVFPQGTRDPFLARSWEYKSKKTIFGMPLVHVSNGIDPVTGKARVSRGFLAVGQIAKGVFAFGGRAYGVFAFGGIAMGGLAFGGLGLGVIGMGGLVAGLLGIGGTTLGVVVIGGQCVGAVVLGGQALGYHHLETKFLAPLLAIIIPLVSLMALGGVLVPILAVKWAKKKINGPMGGAGGQAGADSIFPPAATTARKKTKGEFLGIGCMVQAIGLGCLLLPYIGIFLCFILLIAGGRLALKLVCSNCGASTTKKAEECNKCHAQFHRWWPQGAMVLSAAAAVIIGVVFICTARFWYYLGKPEAIRSDFVGYENFSNGDSIEIQSVERTENQMTVWFKYHLASRDRAKLGLYITTTNRLNQQQDFSKTLEIVRGSGTRSITHTYPPRRDRIVLWGTSGSAPFNGPPYVGEPHLSMYDTNGFSFGDIYFGTEDEAITERKMHLGIIPHSVSQASPNQNGREEWKPSSPPKTVADVMNICTDAKVYKDDGNYEEALKRYLWLFNHAHEVEQVRAWHLSSFYLKDWADLARLYLPARNALTHIRDQQARQLMVGKGDAFKFMEIDSINKGMGDANETGDLFKALDKINPKLAQSTYPIAQGQLVEKGEFELCLKYLGDPEVKFNQIVKNRPDQLELLNKMMESATWTPELKNAPTNVVADMIAKNRESNRRAADETFVQGVEQLVKILENTGSISVAEEIQKQALLVVDDPRLRNLVRTQFACYLDKAMVQLLGVNNSRRTNLEWLPDGQPATNGYVMLFHESANGNNGNRGFGMAFSIKNSGIELPIDCVARLHTNGSKNLGLISTWRSDHGILEIEETSPKQSVRAVDISVGVANGPWKAAAALSHQPDQLSASSGTHKDGVDTTTSYDSVALPNGEYLVNCIYPASDEKQNRMVMVFKDGTVKQITDTPSQSLNHMRTALMLVSSNDFARITEFQVQERPYQWANFHNVSIQKGFKTDVKISASDHQE